MKKALILLIVVSLFSFLYAQAGTRQCNPGFLMICPKKDINSCFCATDIPDGSFVLIQTCGQKVTFCIGDNSNLECSCK